LGRSHAHKKHTKLVQAHTECAGAHGLVSEQESLSARTYFNFWHATLVKGRWQIAYYEVETNSKLIHKKVAREAGRNEQMK
jgi:hypothetical protein